jgi:hypothetical protein
MDLHLALVIVHIVGTILGVGGATLAEVLYLASLKDGTVDSDEKHMMHANYWMIRVGLAIAVLSGIALVWWWVSIGGNRWPLESPKVWFKDLLVLVIIVNAVLLSRRLIPMWLGASLSFTSWWGATILGMWKMIPYSFIQISIAYLIAVGVVAVLLQMIKRMYLKV